MSAAAPAATAAASDKKEALMKCTVDLKENIAVPTRLLLGPGPCNAHPKVLQSFNTPLLGHLDPVFLQIMSETQELLRYAFQTKNQVTLPVSATGSGAMECCFANLVEPKDNVLVFVGGYFALRMVDMATRYGGVVKTVTKPAGQAFDLKEMTAAINEHKPNLVCVVHADTSTGTLQPLEGLSAVCAQHNALLLADCVTSLGGLPVHIDAWGVDAAYSGAQKCLSCPPGVSPVTMNERAMTKVRNRKSTVASWYLDLTIVGKYWGKERTYHHTAPITMNYGLHAALRMLAEEGLEERWKRHRETAELFWAGLEKMGLECLVAKPNRLPSLTSVKVPAGIDAKAVQTYLLNNFNIEIGGGLGETAGKIWRVGLMGFNSRRETVTLLLAALTEAIAAVKAAPAAGSAAAAKL